MNEPVIADTGGGRPGFGWWGANITDHATRDGKLTLCGREVLHALTQPFSEATKPCKLCTRKVEAGK